MLRMACCVLALATCLCFVRRVPLLVATLLFAVAVALIVPSIVVPLATGCVWGIALAVLWQTVAGRAPAGSRQASSTEGTSSRRLSAAAAPLLLAVVSLAGLAGLALPAVAQPEVPRGRDNAAPGAYRVFIPVDEEERPTTDKYQVPERLYEELRRLAGGALSDSASWLICSARYQLSINREPGSDTLAASDISAQYEVVVLRRDSAVRLPTTGVRPARPLAMTDDLSSWNGRRMKTASFAVSANLADTGSILCCGQRAAKARAAPWTWPYRPCPARLWTCSCRLDPQTWTCLRCAVERRFLETVGNCPPILVRLIGSS